ncbi:MAG: hypothetical protein HY927_05130 [Elusimicrobia bacterium]|nr:hypothetical protein [Elusimicrobiota bacterium]
MTSGGLAVVLSLALPALWAGAPPKKASAGPSKDEWVSFVSEEGSFKCRIPKKWEANVPPPGSNALSRIFGLDLRSPAAKDDVATISVRYYGQGNALRQDLAGFVRANATPPEVLPPSERLEAAVGEVTVAGRLSKRFDRKSIEYRRSGEPGQESKVLVLERFLVVPAGEGFYELRLSSPSRSIKAHQPVFDRIVSSFKPGK